MAGAGPGEPAGGVLGLVSALCESAARARAPPDAALRRRLRARAFQLLLQAPERSPDPRTELLAHLYVMKGRVRCVPEHREVAALRALTARVEREQLCENDAFDRTLRMLVALRDSVPRDHSAEMYQRPFTLGLLDEMLPRLPREEFGSPVPYQYYPVHLFELPYSLDRDYLAVTNKSSTYTNYTVESFQSKSCDPHSINEGIELRAFYSPMSLDSQCKALSMQFQSSLSLEYPRLLAPRDLLIPKTDSDSKVIPKVSTTSVHVEEMFRAAGNNISTDNNCSVDIWELASGIDKNIPDDIWDIASKLPPVEERRLIAMSPREITLWRQIYTKDLNSMDIVSEKQFIRHVMYLTIGIESSSFPWSPEHNSFVMRPSLSLEGVSKESIQGYVAGLMSIGTCYSRLYAFAFKQCLEEQLEGNGYIFEAAKNVVRRFLLNFRLQATEIYEKCFMNNRNGEDLNCLPTLLQIIYHLEPLKYEIETVASIYKVIDADCNAAIPRGVNLMSYLYNEISLITHSGTCCKMFASLYSICKVYFKFIERFIFEGELDDRHNEFFIRKDLQYVHSHSKRYWDKGFFITDNEVVPEFLKGLAKYILLCGKSFRLLKLCNPNDPLVLLISTDHPSIKCCTNFEEIARQQQILDLYRTRCLFVSGEPVTFDQIMLKKEAEKKAFTEMASMKQAETLEKIVAERKRLAQLIIAEKQHSLRVLEAAIAETKAAKDRARRRERARTDLEAAVERARDEADTILKDEERNKIMEYYSKLNLEVEKRKVHTEWKIKRLQLDQTRMQLLSTEERNLKREKLELEHVGNDGSLSNSIYSSDSILVKDQNLDEITSDSTMVDLSGSNRHNWKQDNKDNAKIEPSDSMETYTIFDNVAKIINEKKSTDNVTIEILDAQGNKIPTETTESVDGKDSQEIIDNSEFIKTRLEARKNKQKVLANEFGQPDSENNYSSVSDILNVHKSKSAVKFVDSENNLSSLDEKHYFDCNEAFYEVRRIKSDQLRSENDQKASRSKSQSTEFLSAAGSNDNFTNTDAHTEAKRNKLKILGTEDDNFKLISKSTDHLTENNNFQTQASVEAKRNKAKVLGTANETTTFNRSQSVDYLTQAQKEAVINKKKVLGTEYNLLEPKATFKEPLNIAQEEAAQNKRKILSSEYGMNIENTAKLESNRRAGLTLDLRKPEVTRTQERILLGITPTTGGLTPGDFFPQLDLETPTTAEVQFGGPPTADIISPTGDSENIFNRSDKVYFSNDGFKFPSVMLIEENPDTEESLENTGERFPVVDLHQNRHFNCIESSLWNLQDNAYNFDNFDPFGVKGATIDSKDHLSSKMNIAMKQSCYTDPKDLMKEASKMPYHDIFNSHSITEEDTDLSFTQVNIATLTACFQRSIMLPLSYHLEMVNNSILTHYLIDLDMYEHLRSLKDYFFLMDGEFSKTICQNLFQKLVKTINPEELLNFATLHSILDKALGSSIANVNKFSENLSFTITEPPLSFQHSSPDVLQCLSLTYSVSWPMNIILSVEALTRYSKVFQFLVKMRRISWILGQDFEVLKLSVKLSHRDARALLHSPQYNTLQVYRHIMSSLIRALDTYILTTCIQSSWSEFERELKRARTLDDLYDCHVVYIKKVLFRCLLNKRSTPVMKLLNDIFTVILRFSHVLKTRPWMKNEVTGHFVNPCFAQLEELFHLFEKLTRHLHKTITRLMECGYQPHLVELLTMINLNGYYDPLAKGYTEKSMETTP